MIYLPNNLKASVTRPTLPTATANVIIPTGTGAFGTWSLWVWCIPRKIETTNINRAIIAIGSTPVIKLYTYNKTAISMTGTGTNWGVRNVSGLDIGILKPFLMVVSADAGTVTLRGIDSGGAWTASSTRTPSAMADPAQITLGYNGTDSSFCGAVMAVLRSHVATDVDVAAVWAEGNPAAAVYLTGGDNMNSETGLVYHIGMGMMGAAGYREDDNPPDGYTGAAGTAQYPGTPGSLVLDRTLIYDANATYNPTGDNNHQVNRFVTVDHGLATSSDGAIDGPYNVSPFDHPWNSAEVFSRVAFGTEISTTEHVLTAAEGVNFPVSRELALNRPRGIRRIVVDGVSRAANYLVQDADGHLTSYAGGFTAALGDNVIGVDCLPLFPPTAAITAEACFSCGYDAIDQPETSAALVTPTTGVKRFGKGAPAAGTGAGDFREVSVGQTARMMFGPQGGLTAQNDMRCAIHVLHYPGGGAFTLRTAVDVGQAATLAETLGTEGSENDTDTGADVTHTFDTSAVDTYTPDGGDGTAELVLTGVIDLGITQGMVCVRDGTYDMAIVQSVVETTDTTITLEHDLETSPSNSEDLLFGEWDFVTYTVDHDALAEGATVDWRGFEITASAGTRGVMVMACGAWATDRWGWVVCAGGVGATTYLAQQAEMNTIGPSGTSDGGEVRWHDEIENPDIYILTATLNDETQNDIDNIIATIDAAIDGEVVVFADGGWGLWEESDLSGYKTINELWITGASDTGIPGVTIYNDTGIGWDCYMNGDLLNSSEHMSSRGYAFRVGLFLTGLATATANVDDMDDIDYALAKDLRAGKYNQQGQVRGTMPQPMVSI